jgi:hypothetical protein
MSIKLSKLLLQQVDECGSAKLRKTIILVNMKNISLRV